MFTWTGRKVLRSLGLPIHARRPLLVIANAAPPNPEVHISPSIMVACRGASYEVLKSPFTAAIAPMSCAITLVVTRSPKVGPDCAMSTCGPAAGVTVSSRTSCGSFGSG